MVVILLVRMGVVSTQQLKDFRGYFCVCASIAAAVVTPPDVVSMLALLIPMCVLYEAGIIAASMIIKIKAPEETGTALTTDRAATEMTAIEKEQNSGSR